MRSTGRRETLWIRGLLLAMATMLSSATQAENWRTVPPDELAMKSEPKAPGAQAVYLYRQIDRSDVDGREFTYVQIKILTEEGRKYADVELPFDNAKEYLKSIEARTIRPDGGIVPFDGKIYEKPIIKATGVKLLSKTFTLPDVEVGSVVEYRYTRAANDERYIYDSRWILSADLFTRQAKFTLAPSTLFSIFWNWPRGLPKGSTEPKKGHDRIQMEARDIPPFVREDFMPPEDEMKYRVNFVYISEFTPDKDTAKFWKQFGRRRFENVQQFADRERPMKEAVATIIAPGDDPETALRKIYRRTQELRNVALDSDQSEEARKRDKVQPAKDVAEVWRQGRGDGNEIAWLFLALVRAAGIPAQPVLVATRDRYFFSSKLADPTDLNSNIVAVTLNGAVLYLDPGMAYTPFGLLPWSETGVEGLKLDKDGGTWITVPVPRPTESTIQRKAALRLSENGTLEGKLTYTYTGLEAQERRWNEHNEDATDRKEFLENEVKRDVPSGINVTLTNQPEWKRSDVDLVAEFDFNVPGWAAPAGNRSLVATGVFSNAVKGIFARETREHPLYFSYPALEQDDITIALPPGWHIDSLPRGRSREYEQLGYTAYAEERDGALHLRRDLKRNILLMPVSGYPAVRDFYQLVQSGDEQQVVLSRVTPPGKH